MYERGQQLGLHLVGTSLRSLAVFKRGNRDKNPKVARSLGEGQPRNRLQGWPAFFVSPVRWRTGHFHLY